MMRKYFAGVKTRMTIMFVALLIRAIGDMIDMLIDMRRLADDLTDDLDRKGVDKRLIDLFRS